MLLVYSIGNKFQIGYRPKTGINFRRVDAIVAVIHNGYDAATRANDLAIIVMPFAATPFPAANVIKVSGTTTAPSTGIGLVVGYGFTAPGQTGPSQTPFSSNQTVAVSSACNATSTQFCASGTAGVLCPGDAGSGFVMEVSASGYADEDGPSTSLPTEAPTSTTGPPAGPIPTLVSEFLIDP